MSTFSPGLSLVLLLIFVCTGEAGEILNLKNGFSLEASSHCIEDNWVTVTLATGTVEFPAAELASINGAPDVVNSSNRNQASISPSSLPSANAVDNILKSAAVGEGLTPEFVRSVAKVESGLRQSAISPKGAIGLMQLMPATAQSLGVIATDAEANANGGAKYLRQLLLDYHGNAALALAAYNAGPEAVSRYGGIPPYSETRQYITRVLTEYARQQNLASKAGPNKH